MAREGFVDGAGLGDRFVAEVGSPAGDGWTTVGELFGTGLPGALAATGARRGTDSPAVAGQLLYEQYALRLAAPVLAAHLRDGTLLDARPSMIRVLVDDGILRHMAFAGGPAPGTDRTAVVASLRDGLEPPADAVHRSTRVGTRTLRGAIANAVANAFLHLSWPCADRARYVADAEAVLAEAGWADLVRVYDVDGWMYTDRNTCCLAFRTSVNRDRDQHYCLTCPITPRSTTMASFREATASYARRHPVER